MILLSIIIFAVLILYQCYDNKVNYPKRKEEYEKRKKELGLK